MGPVSATLMTGDVVFGGENERKNILGQFFFSGCFLSGW
jgi:hypothetical protein